MRNESPDIPVLLSAIPLQRLPYPSTAFGEEGISPLPCNGVQAIVEVISSVRVHAHRTKQAVRKFIDHSLTLPRARKRPGVRHFPTNGRNFWLQLDAPSVRA